MKEEPAFPTATDGGFDRCGMSLRDYIAIKILQAVWINQGCVTLTNMSGFAHNCYEMADVMLDVRSKVTE